MSVQATSSETIARQLRTEGRYYDRESDTLTLVYWDAQERAIEALQSGDYDIVAFRGGYGSGKSILGARQTLEVARDTPISDNLILAQDAAKGGPTTYKVFFQELPGENTVPDQGGNPENSPWVTDYNRNKSRLTLTNGATIRLGSADTWNRYAGAEFGAVWMDEPSHYGDELHDLAGMITTRVGSTDRRRSCGRSPARATTPPGRFSRSGRTSTAIPSASTSR